MHPKPLLALTTQLLERVMSLREPADVAVSSFFRQQRQLGPRERHTLAETVYNVLRLRNRYESMARSGSGGKFRKLAILGFAAHDEFLKGALQPEEWQWLNHVRQHSGEWNELPHQHNFPLWLAEHLYQQRPQDALPAAQAMNQPAPLDLRVNLLKSRREEVLNALREQGLDAALTPWSPWGIRLLEKPALTRMPLFQSGAIEVQDEGSQLLALITGAKRSEMVVDFCAGAGGKTLALGAMMKNTGRLYAFDVASHRLDALKPRLARSGLSNVYKIAITHERDERVKRLYGKVDRVLVDAPCSGMGTLRRNPDLKWRQKPEDVSRILEQQAGILDSAAKLLKPGGRLVYATCSWLASENQQTVADFERIHPEFQVLSAQECLASQEVTLPENAQDGACMQLWPHLHQTDGFFAKVWQRT